MLFQKNNALSAQLKQDIAQYISDHLFPVCKTGDFMRSCPPKEARHIKRVTAAESQALAMPAPNFCSLEDVLAQADEGFTENLLKRIDATGKKDSEIYKRANLSKQHFSKIRNNPEYRPTKATALALALALELDVAQTNDLIGRAGYALSYSSKFDLILRYFIERGIFDIVQINMALYEFDQPLLG